MNFDVYIFLRFVMIFHNFFSVLCSVLRVSSESDPSRRDRSVSVPAELAAETETLNHDKFTTTECMVISVKLPFVIFLSLTFTTFFRKHSLESSF